MPWSSWGGGGTLVLGVVGNDVVVGVLVVATGTACVVLGAEEPMFYYSCLRPQR